MELRILREPTFHFLVLAAIISIVYWLFNNNNSQELAIDWQEVEARILVTELSQGYAATDQQRQAIEEQLIDDYILVMEAYDMGLQNDARINDILAQKMRHVLSGNIIQPTDKELEDFYQANLFLYQQPARVSAWELVFDSSDPLPEAVVAQLEDGVAEQDLETELERIVGVLPRVTHDDLESIFNQQLADATFNTVNNTANNATDASWSGPFYSNRGQHWLQVTESFPARTPPLEEVAERVRLDWIAREEEARLETEIDRLRESYEISIINRPR